MPVKAVRLMDLAESPGSVVLPSGREVAVRPIDGFAIQFKESIENHTAEAADAWKLAAHLLPDATPDEIKSLNPTMIGHITLIAAGQIDTLIQLAKALEDKVGKGEAPTPAPPSAPAIGLPTS